MQSFIILLMCGLLSFEVANAMEYDECSMTGTLHNVSVSDCDETRVCRARRGQTYSITICFTPAREVKEVNVEVFAIVLTVAFPFQDASISNGCENSHLDCPLPANKLQCYSSSIQVLRSYPPITVKIQWKLSDDNYEPIVCTTFRARLV